MLFSNLVHLKGLLMVLTAAVGTVAGGTMLSSYVNGGKAGPSFLLTTNPSTMSLEQGASLSSTVSVISVRGFSGTVSLSIFFTGSTLTASLSPTSVNVPANGTARSILTVTATTTNSIGNHNMVVIGIATSHGKTTYTSSELSVQVVSNKDFTITSSSSSITNIFGSSNTTTITVRSMNGYSGTVGLTFTAPFGYITLTGNQNPLTLASGGTASSTLTMTTSLITNLGTYNITVTGTSGSKTHSTVISLTVVDPVAPPPESLVLSSHQFVNGTSLSLILQNTGSTLVTLQSYVIRDSSGDTWSLSSLAGPGIAPNGFGTVIILIGANCPGCVYGGIPGLFQQFTIGQSYTVTVTTTTNNSFPFTVTR